MKHLILIAVAVLCLSCGRQDNEVVTTSNPESQAWLDLYSDVAKNCITCHDGTRHPLDLKLESNFSTPTVKARISNDTMPPRPAKLAPDVKTRMLTFLGDI